MEIIICDNKQQASEKAYEIMQEILKKEKVVLGLATGSSPIGLYQCMIDAHKKGQSFAHVTSVNLDEYVGLDQKDEQSYYTFMHEQLFNHIDIKKENIHLPNGNNPDLSKACEEYNAILDQYIPDLQILGIGSNGHIGFNEPNTPFDSKTHIVKLHEKTRQDNARFFNNDISLVPTHSITMGIDNIMNSKKIILVAFGENKAQAIYDTIYGEVTPKVPSSVLQNHKDVIIIVDELAASKIKKA